LASGARKGTGVGRVSFLIVFLVLVVCGVVALVVPKGHEFERGRFHT